MKKLNFYQKPFYNSFSIYKNVYWILSGKKRKGCGRCRNVTNNNKTKTKSENMDVNDIRIFLKKEKVKGVSMNVENIKTYQKMKNKG